MSWYWLKEVWVLLGEDVQFALWVYTVMYFLYLEFLKHKLMSQVKVDFKRGWGIFV